jgi:chorismate--pyruvate lyase
LGWKPAWILREALFVVGRPRLMRFANHPVRLRSLKPTGKLRHLFTRREAMARLLADGWRRHTLRPEVARIESLTAHLRKRGKLTVKLIEVGVANATAQERRTLGARRRVWVRRIELHVDGVPMIAARSATAAQHLKGPWRYLPRLQRRPMGEVLFADPIVARSPRVFRVERYKGVGGLPSRRSLFIRQGAPLVVEEIFLCPMRD